MSELFRLIDEKFSEVDDEWQWTYLINSSFTFNQQKITKITITDHTWRKKGREKINKQLVLNIFTKNLNGERREPNKRYDNRDVFVEEQTPFGNKNYLLVFWFENNNPDWLWVRNCYPMS